MNDREIEQTRTRMPRADRNGSQPGLEPRLPQRRIFWLRESQWRAMVAIQKAQLGLLARLVEETGRALGAATQGRLAPLTHRNARERVTASGQD